MKNILVFFKTVGAQKYIFHPTEEIISYIRENI